MDMKEFLEKECMPEYQKKKWGLFFWNRGGEQFVKQYNYIRNINFEQLIELANRDIRKNDSIQAQTFIDCISCFEKKQFKELVKRMGVRIE